MRSTSPSRNSAQPIVAASLPALLSPSTAEAPIPGVSFAEWIDDTATLRILIPQHWTGVETEPLELEVGSVSHIAASPDLRAFRDGYSVSGVDLFAVPNDAPFELDFDEAIAEVLDPGYEARCEYSHQLDYSEDYYFGVGYVYLDCDGLGTDQYIWSLYLGDGGEELFVMAIQLTPDEPAAEEILETAFGSFDYASIEE